MEQERRLTADDVLLHMRVPEHGDLYVIGCFEKRVTVRSQQVRALNLIYALHKTGAVPPGGKIAVVGGGAAGMTAAAGAARLGFQVTLLERGGTLLPIFQGNTTRWLHPHIYDWPETPGSERHDGGPLDPDEAGLPLLSWKADFAGAVAKELERQWAAAPERQKIRVCCDVDSISLGSGAPRYVTWNLRKDGKEEGGTDGDDFDAVVFAVGFGEESRFQGVPWVPYWKVDPLHQETGKEERHLISGCGDGGLIDLLRVKLRGFDHGQFTQDFVRQPTLEPLKNELLSIEAQARKQKTPEAYLRDHYKKLEAPEVDAFIKKQLRDTRATLTGLHESPLSLNASILNRFLASRLIYRRLGVHYRPGGFTLKSDKAPYEVQFISGGNPETFDHITCRHGPNRSSAIETDFPAYKLQFQKLRERNVLDQTRWPIWEPGTFSQGRPITPGPGPARAPQAPFIGITVESLREGFKGREQALEDLHALLQDAGKVALTAGIAGRVFAHGGGGIGKSRLAIEYAYHKNNAYPGGVFFARMEKRTPQAIWAELARKLFPERALTQDDEAALVFVQRLGDASLGRQLIIFDDVQADSRDELVARLRARVEVRGHTLWPLEHAHVSLLMTTRMRDITWARGFAVERLSQEPATDLLIEKASVRVLTPDERDAAMELAWEVLGGHPLALSLAGAYIRRGGFSFSQYQAFIQQKGLTDKLQEAAVKIGTEIEDHECSIAATYELSRKQLDSGRAEDVLAGHLLEIASFLEPGTPIDRKLLLRLLRESNRAADPEEIGFALARLTKDLALLDESEGGGFGSGDVSIHPLVADYTRWRMEEPARQEVQLALLTGLSILFPRWRSDFWRITHPSDNNGGWEWLSPAREAHVNAILEKTRPLSARARGTLFLNIGIFYLERQNWTRAARACDESLIIRRHLLEQSPNDPDRQSDVVWSLWRQGDVRLAEDNRAVARTHYEEALSISRRLAKRDPTYAEWQRDMAMSLRRLGTVQLAEGNWAGARTQYEEALAISRHLASQDPNHAERQRDVAMGLSRLGDVRLAEGDRAVARTYFEESLSISRRLASRDPNHAEWQRDMTVDLSRLGDVRLAEGNWTGARTHFEESLSISRRLASRDPNHAGWQRDLAMSLSRLGDMLLAERGGAEARTYFEEALSISRRLASRDPNHAEWQRDVAVILSRLGGLRLAEGDWAKARTSFEESLSIAHHLLRRDPTNEQWQHDSISFLNDLVRLLAASPIPKRGEAQSLLMQMQDSLQQFVVEGRLPHSQQAELLTLIEFNLHRLSRSVPEADV